MTETKDKAMTRIAKLAEDLFNCGGYWRRMYGPEMGRIFVDENHGEYTFNVIGNTTVVLASGYRDSLNVVIRSLDPQQLDEQWVRFLVHLDDHFKVVALYVLMSPEDEDDESEITGAQYEIVLAGVERAITAIAEAVAIVEQYRTARGIRGD